MPTTIKTGYMTMQKNVEDVLAPLSGAVWKITVAVDEAVEEDDEVLIIEAMKMETPVFAPGDGKVKEIYVSEGEQVEEDQPLLSIETA
ncbi:MAG: acetyl-CoA carboxylase biotin carboxyl carrier protein subunit [Gammaproteobacteria bacterium]|nr:acetyl-CoA carboxylase biotin carboxyl carrier protein subunit [Gammaproteobacteria bacterium]